jgi:hypothetical protein
MRKLSSAREAEKRLCYNGHFGCEVLTSGQRRERRSLRNFIVQIRCQETDGEDTAGWKSLAGAVLNCESWRLAVAL